VIHAGRVNAAIQAAQGQRTRTALCTPGRSYPESMAALQTKEAIMKIKKNTTECFQLKCISFISNIQKSVME